MNAGVFGGIVEGFWSKTCNFGAYRMYVHTVICTTYHLNAHTNVSGGDRQGCGFGSVSLSPPLLL